MKKHNVGRISAIVLILNILFILIYLTDRNGGVEPETITTIEEEEVIRDMQVLRDENVSDEYMIILSDIIKFHRYDISELDKINSYEWYITDQTEQTSSFAITDAKVTVYADPDYFGTYCEFALAKILNKEDRVS